MFPSVLPAHRKTATACFAGVFCGARVRSFTFRIKFLKIKSMRFFCYVLIVAVLGAIFFLISVPRTIVVAPDGNAPLGDSPQSTTSRQVAAVNLPAVPEALAPTSTQPEPKISPLADLPNQPPLPNPPEVARGIYVTGWSAGYAPRINSLIALAKRAEFNAMVIDIKDFSGHVSYKTGLAEVAAGGAESELRILQPNALIKKLHDAGIYVIGRITVFQDPILAKTHPEWALKNSTTGKTWTDRKGLAWMDPAAKPVWEYNLSIAKDALARGFDEIQFDYIRFASDGDLGSIGYPFWDQKTARHKVIAQFFKFLRDGLSGAKISVDLFGLSAVNADDLGIGQVIEDAYTNFDYVSPMVYPSHFAAGFLGFQNPAKYPYEVVKYSMDHALARLVAERKAPASPELQRGEQSATSTVSSTTIGDSRFAIGSKLRPWLQDFNLGAVYDAAMVNKQIQATYDALLNPKNSSSSESSSSSTTYHLQPTNDYFGGWLLWDPANIYAQW